MPGRRVCGQAEEHGQDQEPRCGAHRHALKVSSAP
jgi:hypothetical protein